MTIMPRTGKRHFIITVNNGREDKSALISFQMPGRHFKRFRVADLLTGSHRDYVFQKNQAFFTAELPRKMRRSSGAAFILCSQEFGPILSVELDCLAEQMAAAFRDAPTPCMWDLGHELACM